MKYCQYCGAQMEDHATACPQCQRPVSYFQQPPVYQQPMYYQPVKPESGALSVCALVFAFIFPFVGLILGIIGVCRHENPTYKKRSWAAIIVAIVVMIVSIILSLIMVSMVMDVAKDVLADFPYEDFRVEDFAGNYVEF